MGVENTTRQNIANRQLEKSQRMQAHRKLRTYFKKKIQLSNFKEKKLASKLFEFPKQLMIATFFKKNQPILGKLDQKVKILVR